MAAFTVLKTAAGDLTSLRRFVETGQLQQSIASLGDIEFEAAQLALGNVPKAKDPSSEVRAAIVHLQSAHVAFRRLYTLEDYVSFADLFRAATYDVWACCLVALSYLYVGDSNLMLEWLERAQSAASELTFTAQLRRTAFHPIHSWKQGGGILLRPVKSAKAMAQAVEPSDVKDFCRVLTRAAVEQ